MQPAKPINWCQYYWDAHLYLNLTSWFIFNCRWSQRPLFWISKPFFTSHVSSIRSNFGKNKKNKKINWNISFDINGTVRIHRSKVVSSQTVPAFGSKYVCFIFSSSFPMNSTLQQHPAVCSHCGYRLSHFVESKCLRDEEVLQTLPVGTTASFYFSDLGPQLTWGTVSPHHCVLSYLFFIVFF